MKKCILLIVVVFCFFKTKAQFNYNADSVEIVQGVYEDLGTLGIGLPYNYYMGDTLRDIGFNFYFNNKTFSTFFLNSDGSINLGADRTYEDILSPYQTSLLDTTLESEFRIYTTGTEGARVCIIQFKRLQLRDWQYNAYSDVNFQIRLYETTNVIEFVYGNFTQNDELLLSFYTNIGIKHNYEANGINVKKNYGDPWTSATFLNTTFSNNFDTYDSDLPTPGLIYRFKPFMFDVAVKAVYALNKNPLPAGNPEIIQARISNKGVYPIVDYPVTLNITGDNLFSTTQKVSISALTDTVISFDSFSPYTLGSNAITVSIPDDDTVSNNSLSISQTVTSKIYSYADDSPPVSAFRWNDNTGMALVKYSINGTASVTQVKAYLTGYVGEGNKLYAVVIDAAGGIVGHSDTIITSSSDFDKYKSFDLSAPVEFTDADFYVGLAQMDNDTHAEYYPFSFQLESAPTRPGAYYIKQDLENGLPEEDHADKRFMIQAVLSTGLSANPYSNTPWTWINGDSNSNSSGVYNSPVLNSPSARSGSVSWKDKSGAIWLYGGYGTSLSGEYGYLSDLWKYDGVTHNWLLIKGDTGVNELGKYSSSYPDSIRNPGCRSRAMFWVDTVGFFWLYGGDRGDFDGYRDMSDLWKYDPFTNQWIWIKGDSISGVEAVYGTLSFPDSNNTPGCRLNSATWADDSGILWLFGGEKRYNTGEGTDIYNLNDLWQYDPAENKWTWVKGTADQDAGSIYNDADPQNVMPGGRTSCNFWKDRFGKFWLFGGNITYDIRDSGYSRNGYSNELWNLDPSTKIWTLVKGDTIDYAPVSIPYQGFASNSFNPFGRETAFSWVSADNFWIYGGYNNSGHLHDLCKYDPSANQWTWVSGSLNANQLPHWGELGSDSSDSHPGSRSAGISWTDSLGNLLLFGGESDIGQYNDIFKIYGGIYYIFTGNGSWNNDSNWVSNSIGPKDIPGSTTVIIDNIPDSSCITDTSIIIRQFGRLLIRNQKELDIIDGNLTNNGLLQGPGKVVFIGAPSDLSSPGTITAPLILNHKTINLTSNTNTSSVALLNHSFINLNQFNLNMGTSPLTADSVNFIVTNSTGALNRIVTGSPVVFNIGLDTFITKYAPVTLINTGVIDSFYTRVEQNVVMHRPAVNNDTLDGNVNLTWRVNEATAGGSIVSMKLQWDSSNEQTNFNRGVCYVTQVKTCEPPPGCEDVYHDRSIPGPTTGENPYSKARDNIVSFNRPIFTVSSQMDSRTFTGASSSVWDNPNNWRIGIVPESTIDNDGVRVTVIHRGMELIIDPVGGVCDYIGRIVVEAGGILTVMPGKVLNIRER